LSAEKYVRIIPTINMIRISNKNTLGTSYIKNLKVSVKCFPASSLKISSIIKSVIGDKYL